MSQLKEDEVEELGGMRSKGFKNYLRVSPSHLKMSEC